MISVLSCGADTLPWCLVFKLRKIALAINKNHQRTVETNKNLNLSNIIFALTAVLLSQFLVHLERIQNDKYQPALSWYC